MPKVSVCIPAYNHEAFAAETLDSVLAQTFQDFELLIVDDASTDKTFQIVAGYTQRYPEKIRLLTHPSHANRGFSATCNLAFEHATGKYLAWLGSDDAWSTDFLERQVALLERDAGLAMVYAQAYVVDGHGRRTGRIYGQDITLRGDPLQALIRSDPIPVLTTLFKRSCLAEIGMLDEALIFSDWHFWLRLVAHYRVAFNAQVLASYRVHGANLSTDGGPQRVTRNNLAVLQALQQQGSALGGQFALARYRALVDLRLMEMYFVEASDAAHAHENLMAAFASMPAMHDDPQPLVYTLFRYELADDFVTWTLAELRPALRARVWRGVIGVRAAQRAFEAQRTHDLRMVRAMAIRSIVADPLRWLRDRNLLAVLAEGLLGSRATGLLRGWFRRLAGKRLEN